MKYIDRIRLPQLTITLSLIIAQSVLADGITSYYPLITEPSWVETSMDNSFFDGNKTFSESTNLLGIDSENRIIMPLINGFRGANPISVISHSDGGDFGDPFDTYGKTDETLSDTSLTVWKTLARSIDGGDGEGVAGVIFESTATYTTLGPLGPGSPPSDGVTIYRRVAKIGEVVVTRYRNDINSTSSLNDINYRSETTSIAVNRSAYVGTAMVPNLYPGSNPLLVTDAYSALVRVSENTITSITENFSNQGGTESSAGVIESGPTTVTTIEWTVKGIGVVRLLIVFGAWLDPIMDNSIFNNGSNVVGVITLEKLIPNDDFFSETLRASGGSRNDAADTILTTINQQITLWPIPEEREIVLPPADATSQLAAYAADAGLSGNDLLPQAIPQNDGVENIIKFAFNMDLSAPASNVLSNTGTSGLPLVAVIEDSQNKKFQLKYIRRKNSGLTYTPMYSTTLDPQSYLPFYGTETVNDIDESFERVCVELPIDIADLCACFGIVKVDY